MGASAPVTLLGSTARVRQMRASVRFLDVLGGKNPPAHRPQEKDPVQNKTLHGGVKTGLEILACWIAPCLKGIAQYVDVVVPFKQQ